MKAPRRGPPPQPRGAIPGALSLVAAAGAACGTPRPPPAAGEDLVVVATAPGPHTLYRGGTTVDLCFDRLLDPRTVDRFDFLLASGPVIFDADVVVQLRPWYGPGGTPPDDAPWCPGSVVSLRPLTGLAPDTLHRVRVRPTAVGWNGETFDTTQPGMVETADGDLEYIFEFQTESLENTDTSSETSSAEETARLAPWTPPAPAPGLASLFQAGRVFDVAGGRCGCHVGGAPTADPTALARLDLSTPEKAFTDLARPPADPGEEFPLVAAGDPSLSFLVHKTLRTAGGVALRGVRGLPMPVSTPLPYPDFVDLARWIEGGAAP